MVLQTAAGTERLGVVGACDERTAHVDLERGIVKRTSTDTITQFPGDVPARDGDGLALLRGVDVGFQRHACG